MPDDMTSGPSNLTFSQRYGYESLPKPMQLEEVSKDLRREVWNLVRKVLIANQIREHLTSEGREFVERVLGTFLRRPESEIETFYPETLDTFSMILLEARFHKFLDFLEIISNDRVTSTDFVQHLAHLFEIHAAAYQLDSSEQQIRFIPRTSKEQGDVTQHSIETLRENDMDAAASHLRAAAGHINARQYADSIADSIAAVESVARKISGARTLGEALSQLEKRELLTNKQLKDGFKKLYAYTNSEEGVRHALIFKNAAKIDLHEAMFMYGACASFAAYLTNKQQQVEQK